MRSTFDEVTNIYMQWVDVTTWSQEFKKMLDTYIVVCCNSSLSCFDLDWKMNVGMFSLCNIVQNNFNRLLFGFASIIFFDHARTYLCDKWDLAIKLKSYQEWVYIGWVYIQKCSSSSQYK